MPAPFILFGTGRRHSSRLMAPREAVLGSILPPLVPLVPHGVDHSPSGNGVNRLTRSIHFPPDGISRSWKKSSSAGQQVGSFARGNSLLYRLLSEEMCNAACEHAKV